MAGYLSEMMGRITVNEAEEEVVGYEGESHQGLDNILLGRVHTDRPYSFQRMKQALMAAWRPRRPINFQELESNMFLVRFDHFVDLKRVLEDGPWSFGRNLVVLKSIDNDEQPSEHEMTKVPFWIRLVNVPLSRRYKSHVGGIAAKLGEVMEVDNAYFVNRGKHIRARVMINITKPLCRYVTVLNLHNIKVQVHVQYERMPNFCYWCGLLGHTVKECLTKPSEIDWKTFTEWPFKESLRASNSRDDGFFSGLARPANVNLSNKHHDILPPRNDDGFGEAIYREITDDQNNGRGRNLSALSEGCPQSSMTRSVGLEPLSNLEDLSHDKSNDGILSSTMKPNYDMQRQNKLISDGCVLNVDRTDQFHEVSDGLQVNLQSTGYVDMNKLVGPDLRQGEIGPEVISHTGLIDKMTRRNKHFHGEAERREGTVEGTTKRLLLDYLTANKKVTARREGTPHTSSRDVWRKPQVNQIKFNCDAAWEKESGRVGMGFVARNCNGEVILSGARSEFYANSPLEAEAKAIWWATQHARSRCYSEVVFESGSSTLVHALRNHSTPLQIAAMFSDILYKSLAFVTCEWSFVKREGNMVAHSIARWALGCTTDVVLEGEVPSCASVLVSKDIVLADH